jgi:pilus assembly protein CpaB
MGRRTLLLIAALVVAALGTVLVFLYANNARNEGLANQELVTVLVAKSNIAVGTTGSAASAAGAFEQQDIPRANVVEGALSDATPIADLVAVAPIFTGQQIIAAQWGATGQTSGLSIPDGKIAISVQLGDPERVAGFIAPGATVAIFATGGPSVQVLLTNIPVIGVGPASSVPNPDGTTNGGNAEQIPSAILTLAVTQLEAQKIIYAQGGASPSAYSGLYFGLMNAKSKVVAGAPGTSEGNLFPR